MKREFLRGLGIDEEHIPKILDEHHDSLKEYKDSASKVTDLEAQLNTANEELSNRDKQIEELKSSTTDNEALQKQLDDYKANNDKYEETLSKVKLESAIKLAVAKDANDANDVLALLDKEGLELDGDTVKGLDDKLTTLRESKPYLFEQTKGKTGRTPIDGDPPQSLSRDQIMGIKDPQERQKAIRENMNLFN
ncbi:phage scaffolding protein [Jeotgalicoccus sp. FSL K6-3177]|uniref:phage scaffolding protein n=1 Tax=Jeotgalicoccus sp. FSL K6-3177 TaxID=2921494 RepID=UPI0030FD7E77